MGTTFGTISGGVYMSYSKSNNLSSHKCDCFNCEHGWCGGGDYTKLTKDNGDVIYQIGKNSVTCMNESSSKRIDFFEDGMYCSEFKPKKVLE